MSCSFSFCSFTHRFSATTTSQSSISNRHPTRRTGAKVSSTTAALQKNYTQPKYTGHDVNDLLESIVYGDFPTMTKLIARLPQGANTLFAHKSNQSALLSACYRGRGDMVRYLIDRGADCSHRNDYGLGAVHYCKQYYWPLKMYREGEEMLALLISAGAEDEEITRRVDLV